MEGGAMAEHGDLKVEVEGRYIVVSMAGSSYRTTYFKSAIAPGLVQSNFMKDDKDESISRKEFEERAWEAANAKARELGWIA
jgi:hypothetical protein